MRQIWNEARTAATFSSAISRKDRAKRVTALFLRGFACPVGDEYVAEAPDRLDVLRMRGIVLDDLPQAGDLHVDRAVEHLVFTAARELHELVPRQGLARMLDQHLEHRKLARRELHRLARSGEHAGGKAEGEIAELEHLGAGRR